MNGIHYFSSVGGYYREAQTSLNQQLRFQIRLLSLRHWPWELVWLTPEGLGLKSSCLGLSCSVLVPFLKLSHGTLQQLPRDPQCVISLFFIWEHLVSTPVQTRLVRQEFTPGKGGGLFFFQRSSLCQERVTWPHKSNPTSLAGGKSEIPARKEH